MALPKNIEVLTQGIQPNIVSLFEPIDIEDCVNIALYTEHGELIANFSLTPGEINDPVPFHSFFGTEKLAEGDKFYVQKSVLKYRENDEPYIDIEYEILVFSGKMY